jgi:RimJ/RimL family protein N-acetyltransferase
VELVERLMAATTRRLQNADRKDILEISRNIWEGHDYLSSVVDQWLQDANSHFYGIEVDGHIVAVGNLRLVEDGRTGWMEGLRVHPEHRGKGFANDITRCLVREAENLGVQRLRYTTSTENVASLKIAKMAGFSSILRMAVIWHVNPKPIPKLEDCPPVHKRSPERVCSLLEASPHIVPHRILTYDWKASDCTCRNLRDIGKTHVFFIALKEERVDSFSFGYSRQGPDQPWWSFTVYATDTCGFLSQLSYNVAVALKNGLNSIVCTFEIRFEKTLNATELGEEHRGTHLVLLEKRVRVRKEQSQHLLH